jgi:hypothetical protein
LGDKARPNLALTITAMMVEGVSMSKPYHLMTPAERTTARIAQNRAIEEKVGVSEGQRIPAKSTGEYLRGTPEERAKLGSVIRKVQP